MRSKPATGRPRTPMRGARRSGRALVATLTEREPSRRDAAAAIARLAALTAAGVAAGDALASSARGGNPLLARLHAAVRRGQPLSVAMASRRLPFLEAEIAVVRAGERGGSTARALALLAERMEAEAGSRRRILSALAYPCLLIAGAAGALSFLSIVVLPSFTSLYASGGAELPAATRLLLGFGDFVRGAAPAAAAAAAACVLVAMWLRRSSPRFARFADGVLLSAPLLAGLHRPRAAHEAAALVALLLESGCEADEALALAARAAPNLVFAERLGEALRGLRHGVALSRAWRGAGLDASGDAASLLEIAETTGSYAQAFARIAALEGAAAEASLSRLCRLAEPAAVLFLAVAVGGGVLALYQPMLGSASLLLGGTS